MASLNAYKRALTDLVDGQRRLTSELKKLKQIHEDTEVELIKTKQTLEILKTRVSQFSLFLRSTPELLPAYKTAEYANLSCEGDLTLLDTPKIGAQLAEFYRNSSGVSVSTKDRKASVVVSPLAIYVPAAARVSPVESLPVDIVSAASTRRERNSLVSPFSSQSVSRGCSPALLCDFADAEVQTSPEPQIEVAPPTKSADVSSSETQTDTQWTVDVPRLHMSSPMLSAPQPKLSQWKVRSRPQRDDKNSRDEVCSADYEEEIMRTGHELRQSQAQTAQLRVHVQKLLKKIETLQTSLLEATASSTSGVLFPGVVSPNILSSSGVRAKSNHSSEEKKICCGNPAVFFASSYVASEASYAESCGVRWLPWGWFATSGGSGAVDSWLRSFAAPRSCSASLDAAVFLVGP